MNSQKVSQKLFLKQKVKTKNEKHPFDEKFSLKTKPEAFGH